MKEEERAPYRRHDLDSSKQGQGRDLLWMPGQLMRWRSKADAGFSSWCFTSSTFFWLWTPASVEASGGINIVHAALLLLQWCRVAHAIAYSIGRR